MLIKIKGINKTFKLFKRNAGLAGSVKSFFNRKYEYFTALNNIDNDDFNKTLNELVDFLNVKDKINVQVRRLSLGERMKMEIIAALLHRPSLVLLDEPTLGLDVISQSKIRDFVKYYNKKYNATFIITSHYTKDIQEMCERVLVLHDGEQMYDGKFNELIKAVNPDRRLLFEFSDIPDIDYINSLNADFQLS